MFYEIFNMFPTIWFKNYNTDSEMVRSFEIVGNITFFSQHAKLRGSLNSASTSYYDIFSNRESDINTEDMNGLNFKRSTTH